jgi:hypothetical protein
MKEVKRFLLMAGCTVVISLFSLSVKATDLKTLTDLAKDEERNDDSLQNYQ